ATTESTALGGPQSNITEAHVKRVLKADKGSNAQLNSWNVKDFTQKGDNYANVVTSVSVSYSLHGQDQSVSYVVKINTKYNVDNDMELFTAIIFKKEAEFYEEIIPLLNSELTSVGLRELRMPKWFYTHCEDGQDMIFLENLRPQGYQMFDRRKVMDVPHATLVLQELARMHAASRLLQARTPDEDFCDQFKYIKTNWINFSDTAKEMMNNFFASSICNAEEMLHKVKGYNEDGDPVEVMLVDLQLNGVASLANDLNFFLHSSLHGNDRKINLQNFLTSYYYTFTKVLEAGGEATPFTLQELHQEYMNKLEYGVLFSTMGVTMMFSEGSDTLDLDAMKTNEDVKRVMEEWQVTTIKMMDTNPAFRSRFLASFDELVEQGLTS
ncbi:putative Ecdysteroid kinase-containing protein 15, partial [Homarus americanus]